MLNSLKQTGQHFGHEINRAWDHLLAGWRDLFHRSRDALTHFSHHEDEPAQDQGGLSTSARWSLLAGEVEETRTEVVVRVEVPGMDKDDCQVTIEGHVLYLRGEKRVERETHDSRYHIRERAYGTFQRAIPLPRHVNAEQAYASFKNGVLTVRLPKEGGERGKSIPVV